MPLEGGLIKKVLIAFMGNDGQIENLHTMKAEDISAHSGASVKEISACLQQLSAMGMIHIIPADGPEIRWRLKPEVISTILDEIDFD